MTENKKPDSTETIKNNLIKVSDLLGKGLSDSSDKGVNARSALLYNSSGTYNETVYSDLTENISDTFKEIIPDIHNKVTFSNFDLVPDITGYFVVFHVPGSWTNKSSLRWFNPKEANVNHDLINQFDNKFPTLCTGIQLPPQQLQTEQVSSRSKTTSIAIRLDRGNEISISFNETRELIVSRYHSLWVEYMEASRRGIPYNSTKSLEGRIGDIGYTQLNPKQNTEWEFYDLDYAGAFWICKFAAMTMKPLFIGKMLGAIPTSIPQNEFVGSRGQHEITRYNISYQIADYYFKYLNYDPLKKDDPLKNLNYFDTRFVTQFVNDYIKYVRNGI